MEKVQLYNTLTRAKEEFATLEPGKVKMFVCGPTVYDYSHIGHAKTYIQMDVLARMLRGAGYDLTYVQNITNIDDKIIVRADELGLDWKDLADEYLGYHLEDMELLGIDTVDKYAKATDYIEAIISQVETLVGKGYGYEIPGDGIYFEISKFKDYGKLSGRKEIKENDSQTRIDNSKDKKGWNDFCLWKFSKPGEPIWNAPFGDGRPGWHIEDTAITETEFGPQYDIHGGALDLIFPHHEAELTQMEAASGKVPFVGNWVHTGFLNVKSTKMSKSLGNFFTIRDVTQKGYDADAVRLFMLQSNYRSPVDFTWENLDAARSRLRNWQAIADLRWQVETQEAQIKEVDMAREAILSPLCDDLNTPIAIKHAEDSLSMFAENFPNFGKEDMDKLLGFINQLLGIDLAKDDISDEQKELLKKRQKARDGKDFEESDRLRDELKEQGIEVRDDAGGQVWSRV